MHYIEGQKIIENNFDPADIETISKTFNSLNKIKLVID